MTLLALSGVALRVPGRTLLERGDLALAEGDGLVALVGPNGAGKSELLRAVVGLRRPDAGVVRVGGLDPARARAADVARRVGYVPQQAADALSHATVADEVAAASRALGLACDLHAAAAALGVERLLARHPWSLSGGERERVAVAAALAHAPPLLVLDEPTTGLDADGRARLLRALARRTGATLVATHEPELARAADRVVRLEDGRLAEARALEVPA